MFFSIEFYILLCIILVLVNLFLYQKFRKSKSNLKYESNSSFNADLRTENTFLKDQLNQLQKSFQSEQDLIKLQRKELNEKEKILTETNLNLENRLLEETESRRKVLSQKKSSEVRLGQIAETLAPFLDQFDFEPENCIFLGRPIDYISFGDDEITFIEIKSGKSQLNQKQRHIRDLIKNKFINWKEIRIK
jgi:predicted Holliday junction resolvase-like endonuclease